MSSPTPAGGARIARLRRTAARIRRRLHPPSPVPAAAAPPAPAASSTGPVAAPSSAAPVDTGAGAGPSAAGSSTTAGTDRDRWWTRLERSVALLVSLSTLAAAGFTWVTIRQASGEQHLTRDGQVTDRYNAAVTNLGDDAEEVRIGGLYALQRIAQDSPRDAPTVVQVISAYVRSHTSLKGPKSPIRPTNDVDAALHILTTPLDQHTPADLHGANLTGADLKDADLKDADLSGADLSGADLSGARLGGAHMGGAHMGGADLSGADLTLAELTVADLTRADLTRADLTGANLGGANLTGANLTDAYAKGYRPFPIPKVRATASPTAS